MLKHLMTVLAIFTAAPGAFAHEGHDEPKSMPAPNGGITRGNEKYFFEYVYAKEGGKIFLYTHDAKPAPVAGIEAKGFFEIPRQKNPVEAQITADGNSWKVTASLPKVHRVTLVFSIKDKEHDDKFKFVAQPKQ